MDDALLASRALAGDLDSFGQLYDRYFHRVYDFAWRILRDADEAAAVTEDVFVRALRNLGGVQKAASFKSWLFGIAHDTAVARAERTGRPEPGAAPAHEEAFGTFDVPDASRIDDASLVGGDHELAALVWEAAAALNPRDYAVLDLHVRQGLDSAEIAGVMGVSKGNAYTMVSRMKTAAADVIGSYVVARRGASECEGLRETLAAFEFPPYSEEVRRAVDAHIRGCERCREARERIAAPLEVFGGLAPVAAPLALKGEIWRNVAGQWHEVGGRPAAGVPGEPLPANPYGDRMAVAAAGSGGAGGSSILFAPPGEGGFDKRNLLWFAAAAVGLLVFAFVFGAVITNALGGDGGDDSGPGAADLTRTAEAETTPDDETTPQSTRTVGVAIDTPTPNLTPDATDTPLPTDTPAPAQPTSTPVVAPPTDTPEPDDDPTDTPPPTRRPSGIPTVTPTPCPAEGCPPPAPPE